MARASEDPRTQEVKQPFPPQEQQPPGRESEMRPRPDYGEKSYRGSGRLQGRKALITGGDSGIGRAVALAFAREGADVAIAYLPEEEEDARETVRVVEEAKRRALAISGDIRAAEHCRALATRVARELGGIDVLVNNAAYQMTHASFLAITPEELDRVFRTNVYATFYVTQAVVAHMRPGASIINTASIQAYQPRPYLLHYAASKAAIVAFTKALSQELAENGIRRDGADLRAAGEQRVELCHRHGVRRDRRPVTALTYWLVSIHRLGSSKRSHAARAAWRFLSQRSCELPRMRR
jgi:NADP-dependent 3-hydroxy acid dehydrogenase YdfG